MRYKLSPDDDVSMFTSAAFAAASCQTTRGSGIGFSSVRESDPLQSGEIRVLRPERQQAQRSAGDTYTWSREAGESEALRGLTPPGPPVDEDPCWPEAIEAAMRALCGGELGLHDAQELAERAVDFCVEEGTAEHVAALEQSLPGVKARQNLLCLLDTLSTSGLLLKEEATRQHLIGLLDHQDRMVAMAAAQTLAACMERGLEAVRARVAGLPDGTRRKLLTTLVRDFLIPESEVARRDEHP